MKTAQEIWEQLVGGDIKLSQALQYSRLLLKDSKSTAIVAWLENETLGYPNKMDVPTYRKFPCDLYAKCLSNYRGEEYIPVEAHEFDDKLRQKTGMSIYTMYISEGIETIEQTKTDGKTISMALPDDLARGLSSPGSTVTGVYQSAQSSYLKGILATVKNELINILLEYVGNEDTHKVSPIASSSKYKSVFISYSYDNHNHEQWVKHFVDTLKANGVKVAFDKDLPYGGNLPQFMLKGIQDSEKVLIIGTPNYLSKVEESQTTGVKFEDVIITDSLMNDIETTKFVPILREGTFHTSFAPLIEHRRGIDFSDDKAFDEKMKELLDVALKQE